MEEESEMSERAGLNVLLSIVLLAVTTAAQALAESTATNPVPADGGTVTPSASEPSPYLVLEFSPGLGAILHTGYFSDSLTDVADRDPAHCLGSPPYPQLFPTGFVVGFDDPGIPQFARASLQRGKTYYWCADEFDGQTIWPGNVWTFTVMPEKAWNPSPPDGATSVVPDPNLILTWERGDIETAGYEICYDIYYGTDRDAVQAATTPNADVTNQSYEMSGLASATDYFWRVDTIQAMARPPFHTTIINGDVWTFQTRGPRTITVDWYAPADFSNIQAAIDDANDGDCVIVADGAYSDSGNANIDFHGKAITVRSENGPMHCSINGSGYRRGFLFQSGEDPNSVLSGFEISNTWANEGAAIYCANASPRIVNCRIIGNSASEDGGGVYTGGDSAPEFIGCVFYSNTADLGGAVHCARGGNATFNGCVFSGNSAERYGAGLYGHMSGLTLLNCTVMGNHATYLGGALMSAVDAEVILRNCILWDNSADSGHQEIACVWGVNLYVDYCTVQGGQANIFNNNATVNWGTGNLNHNPYFTTNTCFLSSSSPCINAGDPGFLAGPEDVDIQREKRVMLGRVDMGADEFNPFSAEFVVVRKERVGRTVFEYECQVVLQNASTFAVEGISLDMAEWSENMTIIDPNVSFGDAEIGPGESATSVDTCTFTVDRSEPIDPAQIIWHVTAELANTGTTMQHTVSTLLPLDPDANNADFDAVKNFAEQWLWQGPAGGIDADSVQDGTVNLADFARFAENWTEE